MNTTFIDTFTSETQGTVLARAGGVALVQYTTPDGRGRLGFAPRTVVALIDETDVILQPATIADFDAEIARLEGVRYQAKLDAIDAENGG